MTCKFRPRPDEEDLRHKEDYPGMHKGQILGKKMQPPAPAPKHNKPGEKLARRRANWERTLAPISDAEALHGRQRPGSLKKI